MNLGFGNNVKSALAADITATQTVISVMPGTGNLFAALLQPDPALENHSHPSRLYAKVTLTDAQETVFEICHLTAVSADKLTVIRGQEGTAAKGWSLNNTIANFATRGSEDNFVQIEDLQNGRYLAATAGGTANALTVDLPSTFYLNGGNTFALHAPLLITPTLTNTGASTLMLTLSGHVVGTYPLVKGNNTALQAGDLVAKSPFMAIFNTEQNRFLVMNPTTEIGVVRTVNTHSPDASGDVKLTANDVGALRQISLQSGSATHWLKIATMPPVVNSETRLEIELSGMSDYGVNAASMAVDRVYITTRGTSASTRVTAATVGNLIQQFSLGRSVDTQNYLVGVTEEVSNGNTTKYNFWLKMSNHTGISSTMNILNSRYSGVTVISDFSGENNSATEPAGIVYATRQQFFTTANPQQAADVRNNAAARMGVSRVLTGATGPSSPGVWSVENSTWAGVPWGSVICTTNGSDLSTAGGSGRFNHYLQISHEAGGKPGIRVAVNINGTFSGWDRVMMTSGGTVTGPTTFEEDVTVDGDSILEKAGKWIKQTFDGSTAENMTWRYWGSADRPSVCELDIDGGIWLLSIERTKDNKAALGVNGVVNCEGVNVGSARMAEDGNIWGTRWNPTGGWLWDAIMAQIQNVGQMSVNGTQWWAKINLNGGTLIVQGGYAEVRDAEVTDRIPLNIAVPNRLLGVFITNRNFAQGYATYNPQVTVLTDDNAGFNFVHGQKERMMYWIAAGY